MGLSNVKVVGQWWGAVVVAGALALGAGACGGGSKATDIASSNGDKEAAASDEAVGRKGSPADDAAAAKAKAAAEAAAEKQQQESVAAGSATSTTVSPGPPPTVDVSSLNRPGPKGALPLKASLKESCVRPGGKQSITVEAPEDSGWGFQTLYADGRTSMMEGYHGGADSGRMGESGKVSRTWVVAPTAPAGTAQVNVVASHIDYGNAAKSLEFTVADPTTGTCA